MQLLDVTFGPWLLFEIVIAYIKEEKHIIVKSIHLWFQIEFKIM